MELLRALISLLLFGCGLYFLFDGFNPTFDWKALVFAITAFLLAYFFWPSKKRGQRDDDNPWLDALELVIELPVELFLWVIRLFTRLFKDGDAGVDL